MLFNVGMSRWRRQVDGGCHYIIALSHQQSIAEVTKWVDSVQVFF